MKKTYFAPNIDVISQYQDDIMDTGILVVSVTKGTGIFSKDNAFDGWDDDESEDE